MSAQSTPRRRSQSPPKSGGSSPKRRPLHRRTDSEVNELASSPYLSPVPHDDDVYSKDPFPQHPSQILPPAGNIYVFEDDSVAQSQEPTPPPKSTRRPPSAGRPVPSGSNSQATAKGKGKARANALKANPTLSGLSSSSRADSSGSPSSNLSSGHSFPSSKDHKKRKSRSRSRPRSFVEVYQDEDYSPVSERRSELSPNYRFQDSPPLSPKPTDNLLDQNAPPESSTQTSSAPFTLLKGVNRLRSQSSAVSSLREAFPSSYDGSNRPSEERPRSRSSPIAPTEAFLEALMDDGTNVQYPKLRNPSATSLRTDSSSVKAAYPPPLALHRKKGHSHLAQAAIRSQQAAESRINPGNGLLGAGRMPFQSFSGDLYDIESAGAASSFAESNRRSDGRISGRWTDEMDDTITDLNPPPLWHKKSLQTLPSTLDSRPTSTGSSMAPSGGFYGFLNDSRTAWAPIYYRGSESKLRFDSAPNITTTDMFDPRTPGGSQRSRNTTQTSISGPSQSPPSAGFPDTIYIPRSRPLQHTKSDSSPDILSTEFEDPRPRPPVPVAERNTRQRSTSDPDMIRAASPRAVARTTSAPIWTYAFDPRYSFNPTVPIPHLSRDKREFYDNGPRQWSAPSFDEDQSYFSRTNRQILLFCVGYVCPIAWMLAAILPIPPRPSWRRPTPVDQVEKLTGRGEVDLFDSMDASRHRRARWWRNLNRFMSVAGICIFITIIILTVIATT